MNTSPFCPISDKKINERVARINALITIAVLASFLFTQSIWFIGFLAADFMLRALCLNKFSPVSLASGNIIKLFQINDHMMNAGPKIFAARIGLFLSGLLLLSAIFSFTGLSYTLAGIIMFFAFLEGVFGICVACILYPYVYKLVYRSSFQSA